MNGTTFTCDACGKTAGHDLENREMLPRSWKIRHLDSCGNLANRDGRGFILCDECCIDGHFIGGLSPRLRELFRTKGVEFED